MKLADLYMYLRADIHKIEQEMATAVSNAHPVLKDATLQLLQAGGKRIRPVFVLLAGKFGDYDIHRLKHIGVSLELIHMASLVHDDVIDDAELRRGQETVKAKYDNRVAMYTGDYIFAKAVESATFFDDERIHQAMSKVIHEMVIGEIEQIRYQYVWDQDIKTYFRRIKRKTALLIAGSCELGAMAVGASREEQRALYRYGYQVGMAYQIIDDVLDFTGTEEELGKPAGGDLLQGNVTLPALYAMHHNPEIKAKIELAFQGELPNQEELTELLQVIKESGGIEYSKALSERYLKKAYETLDTLPQIPAVRSLSEIATYIGTRHF